MQRAVDTVTPTESFATAFEHSITWEDDVWRADPVDVEAVHRPARAKASAPVGRMAFAGCCGNR